MNEWVGQDINVVGPLEIPPSDEFSITDNSHFFGKSPAGYELMTSTTMTQSAENLSGFNIKHSGFVCLMGTLVIAINFKRKIIFLNAKTF